MATKPTDTIKIWASFTDYTTGMVNVIGTPTKITPGDALIANGFMPGVQHPSGAQHVNDEMNRWTRYLAWVSAGSFSPLVEASIVERDSTGLVGLDRLTAAKSTPGGQSILATQPGTSGFGLRVDGAAGNAQAAVFVEGSVSGFVVTSELVAINAEISGTEADTFAIRGNAQTHGDGARFSGGTTVGVGVRAVGGVTSDQAAIVGTGTVSAAGMRAIGGPDAGDGLVAFGGPGASVGVRGVAPTIGLRGEVTATTGAVGGGGILAAGSDASCYGFLGQGAGTGVGLAALSPADALQAVSTGNGYAAVLSASGTRPALRIPTRGSDPASPQNGDIWTRTGAVGLRSRIDGANRSIMHSQHGSCYAHGYSAGGQIVHNATTTIPAVLLLQNAPSQTGVVLIEACISIGRRSGDATSVCAWELYDLTAAASIVSGDWQLWQAPAVGRIERTVTVKIPYPLPSAGARTIQLRLVASAPNPPATLDYEHATIVIRDVRS